MMQILFIIILFILLIFLFLFYASLKTARPKHKRRYIYLYPEHFDLKYEKVIFAAEDGVELKGWFVPAEQKSGKTIILMHGWGMNKSDILKHTWYLQKYGFNLFYFDFRAMGESDGTSSSIGSLESRDVEAAVKYLREFRKEEAGSIALYGLSMGAAAAIYAASKRDDVACVFAEAPYLTYRRAVRHWAWEKYKVPFYPVMPVVIFFIKMILGIDTEPYSPKYNIMNLKAPITLLYGERDDVVPPAEAQELFDIALPPKELVFFKGAAHDKCAETDYPAYRRLLIDFFSKYM
ncbi:hypothetical protein Dip518_001309 [Parelusimicrobium proximum]|uniref:alpha/beta hydrolase n=1 Tax=Parelusimicrobium proximum TaxID=3228953 RepID=UPI003D16B2FE